MARKKKPTVGDWLANQFFNTSLPWLLGLFFIGSGFYYVTTATLENHTRALSQLEMSVKQNAKSDAESREKVRSEFFAESKATAAGIAELNRQTAVMSSTLGGVEKALDKISARLDSIPAKR